MDKEGNFVFQYGLNVTTANVGINILEVYLDDQQLPNSPFLLQCDKVSNTDLAVLLLEDLTQILPFCLLPYPGVCAQGGVPFTAVIRNTLPRLFESFPCPKTVPDLLPYVVSLSLSLPNLHLVTPAKSSSFVGVSRQEQLFGRRFPPRAALW